MVDKPWERSTRKDGVDLVPISGGVFSELPARNMSRASLVPCQDEASDGIEISMRRSWNSYSHLAATNSTAPAKPLAIHDEQWTGVCILFSSALCYKPQPPLVVSTTS